MTRVVRAGGAALIFGGPYSNLQATEAVLKEARRLCIPPQGIICTGDVVAYCADPVETVALIQDSGIHVVQGNCDEQLGAGAQDCACGFPAGSDCERLSAAWFAYAGSRITSGQRAWLGGLPRRLDLEMAGTRLAVIHGGVDDIARFIFASTPALAKVREMERAAGSARLDGVIGGHCGLPFTQIVDGRLWHNPGVIGMPAHDGTPRVWFSVLTPHRGGIQISHRAIEYDHGAASTAMSKAGLPAEYERALLTGIWPSCDVLPQREIRAAGVALEPAAVQWTPSLAERAGRRGAKIDVRELWPPPDRDNARRLDAEKFRNPAVTAKGEPRAAVALRSLGTLWLNTGTLCNITCRNCYIESSPQNDRLVYLTLDDVRLFLDEIERDRLGTTEIGLTGGEPFMNPHIIPMLEECLSRGFRVLVLTNAMRPMTRHKKRLLDIKARWGERLTLRVSLDHFTRERHEEERGMDTFAPTLDGLKWLSQSGFKVAVAGRTMWGEPEAGERAGYARLFRERGIAVVPDDPSALVLFPEMDERVDVPEITTACWDILGKSPDDMMCASSRMVVRRKGAERPAVVACTLLPYDARFELGATLAEADRPVPLNHAHCAKFCVLGGASCAPAGQGDSGKAEQLRLAGE